MPSLQATSPVCHQQWLPCAMQSRTSDGNLLCLRRVVAHPQLTGTMTKSLHSMSPGFRLAAARQASTGSSKSCQDCVQCTQQSLMKSKGCEDTREDPVPPQAKRYRYRGTLHHHLPAIDKMTTSKHFGLHCLIDTGSRLLPEEALRSLQSANFFFSFLTYAMVKL